MLATPAVSQADQGRQRAAGHPAPTVAAGVSPATHLRRRDREAAWPPAEARSSEERGALVRCAARAQCYCARSVPVDQESLSRSAQILTLHHYRGYPLPRLAGSAALPPITGPGAGPTGRAAAGNSLFWAVFRALKWSPETRPNTKGCLACA